MVKNGEKNVEKNVEKKISCLGMDRNVNSMLNGGANQKSGY
jgi:hypothetical protein